MLTDTLCKYFVRTKDSFGSSYQLWCTVVLRSLANPPRNVSKEMQHYLRSSTDMLLGKQAVHARQASCIFASKGHQKLPTSNLFLLNGHCYLLKPWVHLYMITSVDDMVFMQSYKSYKNVKSTCTLYGNSCCSCIRDYQTMSWIQQKNVIFCEIMWSELNNTRAPLFLCISAVGDPPLSATHSRIMHVFTEVGCVCSVLW